MSNSDIVLEYLEESYSNRYCDDCLSIQLDIKPRQQINQICTRLNAENKVVREKGQCSLCGKTKKVNNFGFKGNEIDLFARNAVDEKGVVYSYVPQIKTLASDFDIERIRTEVVRICRTLWESATKEIPPRSICQLINFLRDKDLLPRHIANMMLTLCGLRNVFVYEQIRLGKKELSIAQNAWDIVLSWWEEKKK